MPETRSIAWLCFVALVLLLSGHLRAQEPAAGQDLAITSLEQFWQLSGTAGERELPIKAQFRVNYYDPDWRVMWVALKDSGSFLSPGATRLPIESGNLISIDGFAQPGKQQILWDRTKITVLEQSAHVSAIPLEGNADRLKDLDLAVVEVTALVDKQSEGDATHARLRLIAKDFYFSATVRIPVGETIPPLEGAYVRLRGVFSATQDPIDRTTQYELWVVSPAHITVERWIDKDPLFDRRSTDIESLMFEPTDSPVRVEGVVHSQDPGVSLTVRDGTGQVKVLTNQSQELKAGTRVEAVGYVEFSGFVPVLRKGIFRLERDGVVAAQMRGIHVLRLAEQIRTLAGEEEGGGLPARIMGVVTWSDPRDQSFFVQDASGGIKAVVPKQSGMTAPAVGAVVAVVGTTQKGNFVPHLLCEEIKVTGDRQLPPPRFATFEQANSGAEYGQWIELTGYVRGIETREGGASLLLSTPGGEFSTQVLDKSVPANLKDAVVKVRGVCDALVNERRQMIGLRLLVPGMEYVQVQEAMPADVFSTARRSIRSLRQFDGGVIANRRIQVSGVVILHRPGELLYLVDGEDTVLVISRQTDQLEVGDRVDAVGFPGNRGVQAILREAVYRRTGAGSEPEPVDLRRVVGLQPELNGRLAFARGELMNTYSKGAEQWFQVKSGDAIFEAHGLTGKGTTRWKSVQTGSAIQVIGVYQVQYDDHRRARTFQLHLRSPEDIQILKRAPWWTAARALWVVVGLFSAVGIAGVWGIALKRKNTLLHAVQQELRELNEGLEYRVEERTAELREQMEVRLKSEEKLKETNQRFEIVTRATTDAIWDWNLVDDLIVWNEHFHSVFRFPKGETCASGNEWAARLHPEDARQVLSSLETAIEGDVDVWAGEYRFLTWDGEYAYIFDRCFIVRNEDGKAVRLIGAAQNFTARKEAEAQLVEANRRLLDVSRRAGMAEIASSVLHNVGNVLNSANVSCSVISDRVRRSRIESVARVAVLLKEHAHNLAQFLTSEPVGQRLPQYLEKLAIRLADERAAILNEVDSLAQNIDHIKTVISRQQSFARAGGVLEILEVEELIEDALRMSGDKLIRHEVTVIRDFEPVPAVLSDKHKILEIMINLVRNAERALADSEGRRKQMTIQVRPDGEDAVLISVSDNGVGISQENLTRIFAHGFTTRVNGNGFGLHASALTARSLGGLLEAHSDGSGRGATFKLRLPLRSGGIVCAPVPNE